MASVMRYRSGVVKKVSFPNHASYPIEVGDLCWLHSDGKVYPASACTTVLGDAGTAAQNRAQFATRFVGVAAKKTGLQTGETSFKLTTDPGYTVIDTSGVFEFDLQSATTVKPEDLIGVYNDATDSVDQQVAVVTARNETIGLAVVPYDSLGDSQTTILVDIRPMAAYNQVSSGQ